MTSVLQTALSWVLKLAFVCQVVGAGLLVATYFGFLPWLRAVAILAVAVGAVGAILEKVGVGAVAQGVNVPAPPAPSK